MKRLLTNVKKQTILVTGAAGFIGSHVYDLLAGNGYDVYGVDDLSGGFMRNVSNKAAFTKLDLRDRTKTAAYVTKLKPDIIFHLAADATEGRSQFTPFSALDRNLGAYMNLIVPAIKSGLKKVVLVSSMSVYGKQQVPFRESMVPQPEDIYGITKASMERVTKVFSEVYGIKSVIIRPHNVYGHRQNLSDPYRNVVGIFINCLLQGKNFYIYGDGNQKRAFSHINDVAPAIVRSAFNQRCEGKVLNIGSDEAVTLNKLGQIVLEEFFAGRSVPKKFQPKFVSARPQEVKNAYSDHKLASKLIGFKPAVPLSQGIRDMIVWARGIGKQPFTYLTSLDLNHPNIPKTWTAKLI